MHLGVYRVPRGSSPHTRGARPRGRDELADTRIIPAYAGSTLYSHFGSKGIWDHPRIRGEHRVNGLQLIDTAGSSPHTRGAHVQRPGPVGQDGIIPAYAGSTRAAPSPAIPPADHPRIRGEHAASRGSRRSTCRIIPAYAGSTSPPEPRPGPPPDHPRIRGEHWPGWARLDAWAGSSPHTRGAPPGAGDRGSGRGIIPAYAGSTSWARDKPQPGRDHPRIRGEHGLTDRSSARGVGSSPHTRGAHGHAVSAFDVSGIIPAYAGSTPSTSGQIGGDADHPRIRGEHPRNAIVCPSRLGSSPHTRGAQRTGGLRSRSARIIPAYAGSTIRGIFESGTTVDHPRIRGEHQEGVCSITCTPGSSPHTRGARRTRARGFRRVRIIPAYAGSTAPSMPRHESIGDHPRIRGEHLPSGGGGGWSGGSSPHTRGARDRFVDVSFELGIIPAYAGSTNRTDEIK